MTGRKTLLALAGALTLPMLSMPAAAQIKGVSCMERLYTDAQISEIEALGGNLVNGAEINEPVMAQIGEIAMTTITACTERYGWNQDQVAMAALYEIGRVNEIAYRASGELSDAQLRMVDEALEVGDRTALWAAVEASVIGGLQGNVEAATMSQAMVMGEFVTSSGVLEGSRSEAENIVISEKVGFLLGFMGLQRLAAREFPNM